MKDPDYEYGEPRPQIIYVIKPNDMGGVSSGVAPETLDPLLEKYQLKIISWEFSDPIENEYKAKEIGSLMYVFIGCVIAFEVLVIVLAIVWFIKKGKWLRPLAFIGTVLSGVLLIVNPLFGENIIYRLANFALLGNYGISFFGGLFLGYIWKNRRDVCSYIGVLGCIVLSYFQHTYVYFCFYVITAAFLLVVSFLHTDKHQKYVSAVTKLDKTAFSWLTFVAKRSFSLYLIHQNIGMVILHKLNFIGWTSDFVILIPIVVSLVMAWGIWWLVEFIMTKFTFEKPKKAGI